MSTTAPGQATVTVSFFYGTIQTTEPQAGITTCVNVNTNAGC